MMEGLWRYACALAALVAVAGGAMSGLYIDNGRDQTVVHHTMSQHEKKVVEHEILDLLGLPSRPRRPRSPPLNRSAPSFLLDVYKSLEEEHDQTRPTRSSEINLSGEELHAIDESDVIMTFQSKNHHMDVLRHEHGRHVWFDTSELPAEEVLVSAELRLYQGAEYQGSDPAELYSISVQKVVSVDSYGGLVLEEVASSNTSASSEGWLELNVTGPFAEWTERPDKNLGLFITVHPHESPERDIKPEHIGVVNTRGRAGQQPFLAAFLKATARARDMVTPRRKRDARVRKNNGYSENYARNPLTDSAHWTTRSCQIQTLYVSFKDLEWQDWIIAPDGYGAFYCSGECNFPLNAHMNATNHAIVQTLVHLLNPTQVPKPCCAPTKLTAISVLYFTDDSNVILRKYRNMVVKSCGCH